MKKKSTVLQPSEWYIMEKLWEDSPKTIVQLYHSLKVDPGWSKSTVNTMLGRMVEKQLIYFQEGIKAKQYYPLVQREEVIMAETQSLLDRIYEGSISMMMSAFVKKHAISQEEIKELYAILQEAEEEK